MKGFNKTILLIPVLPVVLIIAWEITAVYINNRFFLPKVEDILLILFHPFNKVLVAGSLLDNIVVSITRVIIGFLAAAVVAVPTGLFMGYFNCVEKVIDPLIELVRPVPPLAWVPLVLAWVGIKSVADLLGLNKGNFVFSNLQLSMLLIIFIGSFFPIVINTIYGVKTVRKTLIESAKTLGINQKDLFLKIIFPAAFPSILTGFRIGMGTGWMCLVAAEMLPGSTSGVGYLIWYAHELMRTDVVIAGIAVIGLVGLLFDQGFRFIEKRHFRWVNT